MEFGVESPTVCTRPVERGRLYRSKVLSGKADLSRAKKCRRGVKCQCRIDCVVVENVVCWIEQGFKTRVRGRPVHSFICRIVGRVDKGPKKEGQKRGETSMVSHALRCIGNGDGENVDSLCDWDVPLGWLFSDGL